MTDPTDLDARLRQQLRAEASHLDLPPGDLRQAAHRSRRLRRRKVATRSIAAVAATVLVVAGAVGVAGLTGDEDRTTVDVAGPTVAGDGVELTFEELEVDRNLFSLVQARESFYAFDIDRQELVRSADGSEWEPVDLPLQSGDHIGFVSAGGDVVVVHARTETGPEVSFVLSPDGAWQRVSAPGGQTGGVVVTESGEVFAGANAVQLLTGFEAAAAELRQAIDAIGIDYDSYGYEHPSASDDPLEAVVALRSGSEVVYEATFAELGLDRATADVLMESPGGTVDAPEPALYRLANDEWVREPVPLDGPGVVVGVVGDVLAVSVPSGETLWSADGESWTAVPAEVTGSGSLQYVRITDLGTFAAVGSPAQPELWRADGLTGPWSPLSLPETGSPSLLVGTEELVMVVSRDLGMGTNALVLPDDGGELIDDDLFEKLAATRVTMTEDGYEIEVGLDGPTIVTDASGEVVYEIPAEEIDAGSERVRRDGQSSTTIILPSGEELTVTVEEVFAELSSQDAELADAWFALLNQAEPADAGDGGSSTVLASTDGVDFTPVAVDHKIVDIAVGEGSSGLAVAVASEEGSTIETTLLRFHG